MQNASSVSLSVLNQLPDFIQDGSPLFETFLSHYYKSQERAGGPIGILNNLTEYFDISKYDLTKLNSSSSLIGNISSTDTNIEVQTTEGFVEKNGTILINDEIVYYESVKKSPSIKLSGGISYPEFLKKIVELSNPYLEFDGIETEFSIRLNNVPVFPPTPEHLIVKLYGNYLIPEIDYTVFNDKIVFTTAPRQFDPINLSDTISDIYIGYLKGYESITIDILDQITPGTNNEKKYQLKKSTQKFIPASTVLSVVIVDGNLLVPFTDYSIYENYIIFKQVPQSTIYVSYINSNLSSIGSGAIAYSIVDSNGQIEKIVVENGGSNYDISYTPRVRIIGSSGNYATAQALIGGLQNITLLSGGTGYSKLNPPKLSISSPTTSGSIGAEGVVTVSDSGNISSITLTNSGSGYSEVPRIQFLNPTGAQLAPPVVVGGSIQSIAVTDGGNYYTTPPIVYIDPPEQQSGIQASAITVLNSEGEVSSVTIVTAGTGYSSTNLPRVRIIQPTGAQILDVDVDNSGRLINIEILTGGFGYIDVPSVYIVDDRTDNVGNNIGGSGAKAVATIFNGEIIDINITSFGSGYSSSFPPKVFISDAPGAKASSEIGSDKITGFEIINPGEEYVKSQFVNCARGVSGLLDYDSNHNIIFKNEENSVAENHPVGSIVKSIDGVFLTKILDRIISQKLPGLPKLDTDTLNITNIVNTIKEFYASKGTVFAIKYLFKILYGVDVTVSYPKDQIIKPSAATWSIDTILRCKIVSGLPINLTDTFIEQLADDVDDNVNYAAALVENYTAIQTSQYDIYELILSEESIQGKFVIPYTTKLVESITSTSLVINVDSTIGWPERNGEIVINNEVIRYKEKTLTQFIECTRGINQTQAQSWDAGTQVSSNFYIYANRGSANQVVLSILGIVDANQTTLIDDGSYYLSGDKLSLAKLGSDDTSTLVNSWLYNVKKLLRVESITFGGLNDETATVVCTNSHGLLVGDQVTVYGANPIIYNGTFLVTSRESDTIFKYSLPQPGVLNPQGNILISIDLNTGKSDTPAVNTSISRFPTNIQNAFLDLTHVYVAASGIPNYKIGPFIGTALLPGNQRKLYRFPRVPNTISLKNNTLPGAIGSFINGVSVWNYKSNQTYKYGPVTAVNIINSGTSYDASVPPILSFSGGGGTGAQAIVLVNGSVIEIEVLSGGTGYTSSPLVSIYGSSGIGASATAVVTNGSISKILMNSIGTGYITEPTITITGGGGSGAIAKSIVRGPIKEVIVTNSGTSYTSNPTVSISSGQGAAAQAYVSSGRITSIAIISAGVGYTTAPKVIIVGEGFGAVAKCTIESTGVAAGRVVNIQILNKGIGYKQGTTEIRLVSIGSDAEFESQIFEWSFNLNETESFDYANGQIFDGANSQFGGEYGHISNPKQLRYVLGDNLDLIDNQLVERTSVLHSPILGWAFDGNPIYGPYGLNDPTSLTSNVVPIRSSYTLKPNLVYDANNNPLPVRIEGPPLSEYPAGTFIEDYQYNFNSLAIYLDEYNGRFTKTPQFPDGIYAYFITLDSAGNSTFPYIIGPKFYSEPDFWNLTQFAIQSYIPKGVVRYRTPFENVDIDIERDPNETTNILTLENGDFLLFEIEDENKDGTIDQSEINDPDAMFEEQKLEVFDYFPKVDLSSKVDIEIETTTKFEDAKITDFLIENRGVNYQVNDRLIFDDLDTGGYGASARIAEIEGKPIQSYTYEYDSNLDEFKGVLQTTIPHELLVGDVVNVKTIPDIEPTSKIIPVRSISGIEKIQIIQDGVGYDPDIPLEVDIESADGQYAKLTPIIGSTGIISEITITNSGEGYSSDPTIRIAHPQTKKKADYFYNRNSLSNYRIISKNIFVNSDKSFYVMGSRVSISSQFGGAAASDLGYFSKHSSDGTQIYGKVFSNPLPTTTSSKFEIISCSTNQNNVYLVGRTYPNQSLNAAFNPDIFVCRLVENETGSSATVAWKIDIAGISGITRADYITDISCIGDNIVIAGYTNTNTTSIQDGFIILLNSSGNIISKRKITSNTLSEKIYGISVDSDNNIIVVGSTSDTDIIVSKLTIQSNSIIVSWIKKYSVSGYKFTDISFVLDEYNQIYITSTPEVVSTQNRERIQLLRLTSDGVVLSNTFTRIGSNISTTASKCSVDVFGEINVAYSSVASNLVKSIGTIKYKYDGSIIKSTVISSPLSKYGYTAIACGSDSSGDQIILATADDNRTKFLFNAESSYNDVTGNISALLESGHSSGISTIVTDPKYGTYAYNIPFRGMLRATTTITPSSWTLEGWFKNVATTTKQIQMFTITDGSNKIVMELYSVTGSSFGKVRLNINGVQGTLSTLSTAAGLISSGYTHIKLVKTFTNSIATYTLYLNNVQFTSTSSSININPTQIDFGNTSVSFSHGMVVDDIRLSNYAILGDSPTSAHPVVDYGTVSESQTTNSIIFKTDKNCDSERLGVITLTNNNITLNRSLYTVLSSTQESISTSTYALSAEGFQILDFNYTTAVATTIVDQTFNNTLDFWSSRTSTIPTPGGSKVKVLANVLDKFYFKYFNSSKVDNVLKIQINQDFDFNIGSTLIQKNSIGATIATAKILYKDLTDNTITVSDKTGNFVVNSGTLESSDSFINEIRAYSFPNIINTVLGTFDVTIPNTISAKFKIFSEDDYLIRIDTTTSGSPYVVGSVASISSSQISFTSDKQQITITGLTGVSKISLVTNLTRILKIDAIFNTNLVFVRSDVSHYLTAGKVIYSTSSPTYQPLNGTFDVTSILSKKEFIVTLREIASTNITNQVFTFSVKTPILKFIYGQQYTFDTSHPSMQGHYLSFYKDNLYKIEYTFKNIVRRGTPGIDEPGNSPFISFKVTDDVSNISYYADPSNLTSDGPSDVLSYIDVLPSPYIGTFTITNLEGGSVTQGPDKFKFIISFEPEKSAITSSTVYSTTSTKAVGAISRIRLISGGGFYKKLPIISSIQSNRKIERVEIVEPGTEYAEGEYFGVPILGDGTGGKVSIRVDGSSDPAGQIVEVTVTDPGKGYTTAYLDVDAIDGILGSSLEGSGAELNVVIPPQGSGASIFTKGKSVGKIKNLKNNNFGFNYSHDYTLRPEITFPINLQLINTSILNNIKITNPGTGYTTPPEVIITGGGGSGAIAQALIKNGRISDIIVKDPGFGYSSNPTIELKSSFTYVVNLDLGLFQFAFPHGISNASEVQFQVQDLGEGAVFPLTSFGYIDPEQIYYAISGSSAGLEDDQLRIALTIQDAISGNYISFANNGTGRQIVLTSSFGGSAESNVITGRFLSGELVYQGSSLETASATGYVSTNSGWQTGPRLLKLTSSIGEFSINEKVTGLVSRASGTIQDIIIAKGVLEVDSITKTVGQFINDIGKPSEIVQKIQDSYLYQTFSYNIKSPITIGEWRDTVIDTTHPAGFKVFAEIDIVGGGRGQKDITDFEITRSVNLIESTVVSNIDNFALVEPIYEEFDNTQVLFRSTKLTSSEEILTSIVERLDDISYLFDGARTVFPATINGNVVIANTSQFMIVINGINQSPGQTFSVQQGNIVFTEPPAAPTKISYATATVQFQTSTVINIYNISGILPELGNTIRGLTSNTVATVVSSTSNSITLFNVIGSGFIFEETIVSAATGLNCNFESETIIQNSNIFEFQEKISNLDGNTAIIEEINLLPGTSTISNTIIISKTSGTYDNPSGFLDIQINDYIISAKSRIIAKIIGLTPYIDPTTGIFIPSISISDSSSFFGLLFSRIVNPLLPNAIIDDLSKSLVEVVDVTDLNTKVESIFVPFENITNILLDYTYNAGSDPIIQNDILQSVSITYGNETNPFTPGETLYTKKLSYYGLIGGNIQSGDTVIGSISGSSADIIGINYGTKTLYLGNTTGSLISGETISCEKTFVTNNDIVAPRFADASDLILDNKLLIADVAVGRMLANYPGFTVPGGNQNCKDDIIAVLEEICFNVKYGGNHKVYDAATMYINNPYLLNERDESVYAFNQARDMAIQAMRNETITIGGYSTRTQVKDLTIEGDQSQVIGEYTSGDCANVASSISTLFAILTQAIGSDAVPGSLTGVSSTSNSNYDASNLILSNKEIIADVAVGRMLANYPGFTVPGGNQNCKDDIIIILEQVSDNLRNGGNNKVWDAANLYITGSYLSGEETESIYAFNQARDMAIQAMRNETITIGGYSTRTQVKDLTITVDPSNPTCATTASSITTLFSILTTAISTGSLSTIPKTVVRTNIGTVSATTSNYIQIPIQLNQLSTPLKKITTGQINQDSQYRFVDAATLLRLNSTYIIEEAAGRLKSNYSDLTIPGDVGLITDGTARCKLDLSLLLDAVIKDIENGGNYETVTAAKFYLTSDGGLQHIRLQALQSLYAHTQMSLLCQDAITGDLSNTPNYTNAIPVLPIGISIDPSSPECANVKSAINSLWEQINDIIAPSQDGYADAANLLWFNKNFIAQEATGYIESYFTYNLNGIINTAFSYPNGSPSTCERDISDYIIPSIITDLLTGGNANIIAAMEFYVSGIGDILYVKDELLPTVVAFEYANILCQHAVNNWIIGGTTSTEYTTLYGATATKYKDPTITSDDGTYGGNCERIKAAIDSLFNIAIGILIPERDTYYSRYYDASNLIESNKTLIADVAVGRMLANYPGFTVPGGNQNCKDDIITNLDAIVYDLRNGGNARIYDYSQIYTLGTYLAGETAESIYAFNQARDMAIQAMRNETITRGGYSTLYQVKDLTITVDPSNPTCANVASSITTLFSILTTAVTAGNMNHVTRNSESTTNKIYRDAAKLLLFNKSYIKNDALQQTLNAYPTFSVPGGNAKCLRDIEYIIDAIIYDLLTDGNSAMITAANTYIDAVTGTILSLSGELIQSVYAYGVVKNLMKLAVAETLQSPSAASGQYAYTESGISIVGSNLTEIQTFIDNEMNILLGVLNNPDYIEDNNIISTNSINIPNKSYPIRQLQTPLSNSIFAGEYIYGNSSNAAAEISTIGYNRAIVKDIYLRFEINYTSTTQIFEANQVLTFQGQPTRTCTIISIETGEFVNYIDVLINQGPFTVGATLLNPDNFTASIVGIQNRIQLVNVTGEFSANQYIKALNSTAEITCTNYDYNVAPVLSNTGSKLILETSAIEGEFLETRRVYSSVGSHYINVIAQDGLNVGLGDIIQTSNIYRLTISLITEGQVTFEVGEKIQNVIDNIPQGKEATVVAYEILPGGTTAYLYVGNIFNDDIFAVGELVYYYVAGEPFPFGIGEIDSILITPSTSRAKVERIMLESGGYKLILSNVSGTLNPYAQVLGSYGYKSIVTNVGEIQGSISRYFLGFNGIQTDFKLTINNGEPYFPDSDGHMLIFINGILQPPDVSYTAFSDIIQFTEPPDSNGSFNGVYVGKLRKLDDISIDFDSLRNSFNLKVSNVFYSLTLTDGVQSTSIKPDNNIIISLNGVIQEPGVAFELVGSRIIFAEIPRAGSTFVGFSYIGSDSDVIAATVIPPIEPGDKLSIEAEDQDRTVAIIESSNSLVTFDYLGSVLGRNAQALTQIISGRISKLQLTSGGDGYTSRPIVSFDSSTGFDAQAKALVGISRVDVVDRGSGYAYPEIEVITQTSSITGFVKVNSDGRWTDLLANYSIPNTNIIITIVWPAAGQCYFDIVNGGDNHYVGQRFTIPGNLISHTGGGNMIIEVSSVSI